MIVRDCVGGGRDSLQGSPARPRPAHSGPRAGEEPRGEADAPPAPTGSWKQGSALSDTVYGCPPYRSGNEETCTFAAPAAGVWYVRAKAYSAFAGLSVSATFTAPPPPPPTTGPLLDRANLSGATGSETAWTFVVPAGKTQLTVALTGGTGDADLYVRNGAAATQTAFDCRPYQSGNEELCTFTAPAAGTWHVMVHAYSGYAGARLTASVP